MTNTEIARRIEIGRQYQGNPDQVRRWFEDLQNELLGDPSGMELQAMRHDMTAEFWSKDKREMAPRQEAYWRKLAAEARELRPKATPK